MPRLVVTMPAFNAESTIRQAVNSTLRAMPKDSELLVFDDKSTDKTLEVLESISDRRLRVIAAPENVGKGMARRRLLAESDSEFIASMDADDLSLPWRFSVQFKALSAADVIFGSAIRFGRATPGGTFETGRRTILFRPSSPVPLRPAEFPAALLFHNPVWQPSLLARRSQIEGVGGYHSGRFGEDWELWLRLAESGARMCRIAPPVIAYRESPNQQSRLACQPSEIRNNLVLRQSYVDLFNSRVRSVSLSLEPGAGVKETMMRGLIEQLPAFSPLNRRRYAGFIRADQAWGIGLFPA